ncbi:MAG: GAF domain-containing protein [Candidatus Kapabacteria bacterium]|nr:GAF domain-containing protein [Ignavibacteriota bacterium]MCW5885173.1 GAF domain-containing protein [Candidatus Kapabacteria bacterium]
MSEFAGLQSLMTEVDDFIANASNFSSYIFEKYKDLNWAGFYMLSGDELILGPFQGKPACIRIQLGKGVCGTAAIRRESLVVDNVHQFDGHIACDSASNSELVIPLIFNGKLFGVFDVDSPILSRFDIDICKEIETGLKFLLENSNMDKIYAYYNP